MSITIEVRVEGHIVLVSKGVSLLLRQETIISDQELSSSSCTRNTIYLF